MTIKYLTLLLGACTAIITASGATQPLLRTAIIADCQYASIDDTAERSYRNSKQRLSQAIKYFNDQRVNFTISLGDIIDGDIASFDSLCPILSLADSAMYHVLGNHDFLGDSTLNHKMHSALNLSQPYYYSISVEGVRLILLNTNERTLYAAHNEQTTTDARRYADSLTAAHIDVYPFNGSVSQAQLSWLDSELNQAEQSNQIVVIFSHHPLYFFLPNAVAQNSCQVVEVIDRYRNVVVAHLSGHLHYGGRSLHNGVHYLIMKGMVQKQTANFASILSIWSDRIEIDAIDGSRFSVKYQKAKKSLSLSDSN